MVSAIMDRYVLVQDKYEFEPGAIVMQHVHFKTLHRVDEESMDAVQSTENPQWWEAEVYMGCGRRWAEKYEIQNPTELVPPICLVCFPQYRKKAAMNGAGVGIEE